MKQEIVLFGKNEIQLINTMSKRQLLLKSLLNTIYCENVPTELHCIYHKNEERCDVIMSLYFVFKFNMTLANFLAD